MLQIVTEFRNRQISHVLSFLFLSHVTLRVDAVCVSYNEAMANNGSCAESRPGCCTLFPDSAGTFDDGVLGCDCCCSSCADNETVCAQDVQQEFCTPGDCCYTTTMDLTNADFDPQVEDVVKFYNEFAGYGGTTYRGMPSHRLARDGPAGRRLVRVRVRVRVRAGVKVGL